MNAKESQVVKNCMDTIALRVTEKLLNGEAASPADTQALMALSLWRIDDEGLAVVIDEED